MLSKLLIKDNAKIWFNNEPKFSGFSALFYLIPLLIHYKRLNILEKNLLYIFTINTFISEYIQAKNKNIFHIINDLGILTVYGYTSNIFFNKIKFYKKKDIYSYYISGISSILCLLLSGIYRGKYFKYEIFHSLWHALSSFNIYISLKHL